ncbi:MAG: DUF4288 domain-containing protein [Xanthomonadaceae bacterium]|jgi:hypothetical protein|nr:DUF4288 domain-containing protein [Xanthomonadaceae bacterium]
MAWYAIRTVYLFGTKKDGTNVFEERIVAFEAASWDEAHIKADKKSRAYAAAHQGVKVHPEQVGYRQDGAALIDGYELWSELFESTQTLEEFYQNRYASLKYRPE